jgi:hypothetical protein
MTCAQAAEVEADLAFEEWNRLWMIHGQDVVCRLCQRRQRLVSAHEVFAHRRACIWSRAKNKHYPWQTLASILRPFDWHH